MSAYNKAWAAAVVAALTLVELYTGFSLGLSENAILALLAVLSPVLVWLVPNRPAT